MLEPLFNNRPVEMKKIVGGGGGERGGGGGWGYQSRNVVGHHGWSTKKIVISNRLKRLEKLNICSR